MNEKLNFDLLAEHFDILEEERDRGYIFEMANLSQETTGLPMIIWTYEKNPRHAQRIKVQKTDSQNVKLNDWVTVTIEDNPQVFGGDMPKDRYEIVKKFISLNKKVLLQYSELEITTDQLIKKIIKV